MAALLTSEKFVKSVTNISDNVAGKYLLPSIRESQDIVFKGIVGGALYDKLVALGESGEIRDPENAVYFNLVSEAQYFLAYSALVELTTKVSYKVGNLGVAKTQDENIYPAGEVEIVRQQEYYQGKADSYCLALQTWILERRADYPELTDCVCDKMKSNLYSSASCGIFLGGARGRILPKV